MRQAYRGVLARACQIFACQIFACLVLSGCVAPSSEQPALTLRPVAYDSLPGWRQDDVSILLPTLLRQCRHLELLPADTRLGGAGEARTAGGKAGDWIAFCQAIRWVPAGDDQAARKAVAAWLQPYLVSDHDDDTAHFTGYFEPVVSGSLFRDAAHAVPVYRRPDDLVTRRAVSGETLTGRLLDGRLVPYWTRAQIDQGALAGRELAICWLSSPTDLFVLQVQGSGRVRLQSGQILRVGYAGRNGADYVPIGRLLVQDGQMSGDTVSMQSIRDWLLAHPEQARGLLERNPSYVFFRVLDTLRLDQGPIGALGLPLLPRRSIAVDPAFLPLGAPVWVDTVAPSADEPSADDGERLRRLMLAQDTGAGIDGPTHADIFFGWGDESARQAGIMHKTGRMVVLLPRPPSQPR